MFDTLFARFWPRATKLPNPPKLTKPANPPLVPPDTGRELVQHFERCAKRLPNGMIGPYLDRGTKGVPTIGWGNTRYLDGKTVTMADPPITQASADALFEVIYQDFYNRVAAQLPGDAAPHERAAFASFAYNVGFDGFVKSTALFRFKLGDKAGAATALEWWVKDEGVTVRGLQRRRRAERLVMEGVPLDEAVGQAEKAFPPAPKVS